MPQLPSTAAQTEASNVAATETPAADTKTAKAASRKTVKKATKKVAKKAETKKAAKKTAKAPAAPKEKKEGLRKPQQRILTALLKHGELDRAALSAKAKVDSATCTEYVGSANEEVRLANDKKHFPSLISLGLVRIVAGQKGEKETIAFALTAKGKTAAEKLAA